MWFFDLAYGFGFRVLGFGQGFGVYVFWDLAKGFGFSALGFGFGCRVL